MIPDFFPRQQYYCVLDEQPDFLVEANMLTPYQGLGEANDLIVNPRCWMSWQGSPPAAFGAESELPERLFAFPWMIWVDDAERGAVWPYWLGPDYAHLLERLTPGRRYDGGLPSEVETTLRIADILVPRDGMARRRHDWRQVVDAWAPAMAQGYMPIQGVFPPFHTAALRRYYRYHTRIGTFVLGDEQTSRRFVSYDEPVTAFFHRQLTRIVSDLTRRVLDPSYNYLSFYQGGAGLDAHTDRDACEYTLTVCIDATPDPATHGGWPLHLMSREGPVSVIQGVGDGLLFRGRELLHWRDRLPDGYTSSSILFHFVDAG